MPVIPATWEAEAGDLLESGRQSLPRLATALQPGQQNETPSHASVSQVAGITGRHNLAWLIFVFLVEMGSHHVGQAGIELLALSDLPASVSQNVGITGVSYCAQPFSSF